MKWYRIGVLVLLGLAVAALAGVGRPEAGGAASTNSASNGITVTGVGTVKTVPNEAEFSLSVQSQGASAREALAANSKQMERVLAALRSAGVAKSDVQTQDVSVSPSYADKGQVNGYTAGDTVSVKIHDLAKAGAILDAASKAGANQFYGPSLTRSDQDAQQTKALRDAVANARTKAQALADAAGVRLGTVTAITEGFDGGPQPYFAQATGRAMADKAVPIQPGTQDVQATVTVTFAIA